ncbi:acyl carrier protein [Streptomyces acidiscabies]|uniref:Acyl carrier protein n=1 Tax=Streptomyces acidiscabies TaxID=42234 RepID=A0A0L0JWL4_9ACTN|nr:acyl carrier protein [Streptomyces acidiscabies]KND30142.1 actinorhodin polyketide synthase acyl carrier protein [Streptomyces acidiscabies]MBZ3912647.1 acyl carrier protein [Streptomyces acidiscabies]MDX2958129.1 acyl carrier protein [Streptomyces acidiscabies]MDX3018496.1 acyl carrier protein [Streptomyces acidiscabies]MDX3796256.1 acyl carrier protein [Streptomyces acidiscabies]
MSTPMSYDDLRLILVEAAGSAEGVDLMSQDIIDSDLYDVGYDSLALIEVGARIQQRYGVDIPDEEVTELRTFRTILDRVNSSISAAT